MCVYENNSTAKAILEKSDKIDHILTDPKSVFHVLPK